jgi:tRNA-dihydrouridine synthase 1
MVRSSAVLLLCSTWNDLPAPEQVDASELPFRMLVRRYGAQLCYTPMLHAGQLIKSPSYLDTFFTTCAGDRPLIAQFCGNDPATVLQAAQLVQDRVDAVDLNLGCPQGIARKGHYGSFLLEETSLVVSIVSTLARGLRVPVTCKIRRLPEDDRTLALVLALQAAGCALITVHGRTRFNMKERITAADWDIIRRIKAHPDVKIPVIANGGIAHLEDVEACRAFTGADGVMSSEAILENPALFTGGIHPTTGRRVSSIDLSLEYLELATTLGGADVGCVKGHLMKLLFGLLSAPPFHDLRSQLAGPKAALADFWPVLREVERRYVELTAGANPSRADAASTAAGSSATVAAAAVDTASASAAAAPAQGSLASREEKWRALRRSDPTLGLSHPAYLHDLATPGLWYMRYRKAFNFDAAVPALFLPNATIPLAQDASADVVNVSDETAVPQSGSKRQRSPDPEPIVADRPVSLTATEGPNSLSVTERPLALGVEL